MLKEKEKIERAAEKPKAQTNRYAHLVPGAHFSDSSYGQWHTPG